MQHVTTASMKLYFVQALFSALLKGPAVDRDKTDVPNPGISRKNRNAKRENAIRHISVENLSICYLLLPIE